MLQDVLYVLFIPTRWLLNNFCQIINSTESMLGIVGTHMCLSRANQEPIDRENLSRTEKKIEDWFINYDGYDIIVNVMT